MGFERIYKKNSRIVSRVIGDETVLLPLFKTSDDISCIYTLNRAAAWVWEKMDGRTSLEEIKREALKIFDVTPQIFDREIKQVLKDLQAVGALARAK